MPNIGDEAYMEIKDKENLKTIDTAQHSKTV